MPDAARPALTVEELRLAFDQSFAVRADATSIPGDDYLLVGVATHMFALRLSQVASLHRAPRAMRLPDSPPALLGLVGFRRTVYPLYDLSRLLGCTPGADARWALVTAARPLALAFARLGGHRRVAADPVTPAGSTASSAPHQRGVVRIDGSLHPIVDLDSVSDAIAGLSGARTGRGEPR